MINYKQKESKIICEENQISSKKEKQNNKTKIRGSVSGRENVSAVLDWILLSQNEEDNRRNERYHRRGDFLTKSKYKIDLQHMMYKQIIKNKK